jgi:hypothetical protein
MAQTFVAPTPGRPLRRAFDQSGLRQGFFTDDLFARDPRRPSSPLRSSLGFRYTQAS